MLTVYDAINGQMTKREGLVPIGDSTVWLDMFNPTPEEDAYVEKALGLEVPTRAEMREIEASSRLYQENGAYYMTASIVHNTDKSRPDSDAFTFILKGRKLVTVRYAQTRSFQMLLAKVEKGELPGDSGAHVFTGLVEIVVDRVADLIERAQDDVDKLAISIFDNKGGEVSRARRYEVALRGVGRTGDVVSRAQESARSLQRVLHFFKVVSKDIGCDAKLRERISGAARDVQSLIEHLTFLSGRSNFLLDATLGMISTEQNQIIKLFSVMAVALMPPTLIASIYGMNFKHIPELEWPHGYPMALGLMLVSAIVPFIYFRRKGWL